MDSMLRQFENRTISSPVRKLPENPCGCLHKGKCLGFFDSNIRFCVCRGGFSGNICQSPRPEFSFEAKSNDFTSNTATTVACVLLAAIIILGASLFVWRKYRSKQHGRWVAWLEEQPQSKATIEGGANRKRGVMLDIMPSAINNLSTSNVNDLCLRKDNSVDVASSAVDGEAITSNSNTKKVFLPTDSLRYPEKVLSTRETKIDFQKNATS